MHFGRNTPPELPAYPTRLDTTNFEAVVKYCRSLEAELGMRKSTRDMKSGGCCLMEAEGQCKTRDKDKAMENLKLYCAFLVRLWPFDNEHTH